MGPATDKQYWKMRTNEDYMENTVSGNCKDDSSKFWILTVYMKSKGQNLRKVTINTEKQQCLSPKWHKSKDNSTKSVYT